MVILLCDSRGSTPTQQVFPRSLLCTHLIKNCDYNYADYHDSTSWANCCCGTNTASSGVGRS